MIEFNCPNCGRHIRTKDGAAGRAGKCTNCGTGLIVPSVENSIQVACPHCDNTIQSDSDLAGQIVSCPHCDRQLMLPPIARALPVEVKLSPASSDFDAFFREAKNSSNAATANPQSATFDPFESHAEQSGGDSRGVSSTIAERRKALAEQFAGDSRGVSSRGPGKAKWPNYKDMLHPCRSCGTEIAYNAKACPKCGRKIGNKERRDWAWACTPAWAKLAAAAAIVVVVLLGALSSGNHDGTTHGRTTGFDDGRTTRQRQIERQFSAWDGSHSGLTKWIKDRMHNPKSYEHVETTYRDLGDHLSVTTKFRGTNAFGGVVTTTVVKKVSLDGDVIQATGL